MKPIYPLRRLILLAVSLIVGGLASLPLGAAAQTTSADAAKYPMLPAPEPRRLILKSGDRLAICGDSITEQKMYSRIIEDYLTMCVPQLKISVRQYGWSGEKASGFLARMTNDCLRFKPTIATTCYGMNDHEYRAYEDRIGEVYRSSSTAIVEAFEANGVRVIQGSPGCVGYKQSWRGATSDDLNSNLCHLRNIGIEIAEREKAGFADVFQPMLKAGFAGREEYGTNYTIAGRDAVHPGWAGQTIMAYAFLKAMGLDGKIGTFTVNLKKNKMKLSDGHELLSASGGEFHIQSSRYPFCACEPPGVAKERYPVCGKDDLSNPDSIRSGMKWVPFNDRLNRLVLVVKNAAADRYQVFWGGEGKAFTRAQLEQGINLAAEFPQNPFSNSFAAVDAAVAAKQAYETLQVKKLFRGETQRPSLDQIRTQTEKVFEETQTKHAQLEEAIRAAFKPVTHTIRIVAD